MENLEIPLSILIYSSIVILFVVTFFVVKLLLDLSNLANSLQSMSVIMKHEVEPTLKELQQTLKNVNSITSSADEQVANINKGLSTVAKVSSDLISKTRIGISSLIEGILTGVKVYKEEK